MDKDKIYKRTSILFWLNILAIGIIFLIILQQKGEDFGNIPSNAGLERWAIIFTIASIPFALKMFHLLLKKMKDSNPDKISTKYMGLYIGRLLLFDLVAILNIIAFQIYESNNFIYLTIIIIFAMMFCYPNRNDLTLSTNEDIAETSATSVEDSEDNSLEEKDNKVNPK